MPKNKLNKRMVLRSWAGHVVHQMAAPEDRDELDAMKANGHEHEGRVYRYAATQDGCVVFVAGLPA